MFKKLEDFIKNIKERDKDVPLFECSNDKETFPEDVGCPSQPNIEEDKPNLFDELGGIPAPESDDCDEEDTQDELANKRRSSRSDFSFLWGRLWRFDDETDEDY